MKKTLSFVPLLMLISCAGVKTAHVQQDGDTYKLTCNEFNLSLKDCKAHAETICSNGYDLLHHHEDSHPDSGDGFYMPSTHYLKIKCT